MAEDNFGRLRRGTFIKRSAEVGGRNDTQDTFSFNIEEDNNLSVTLTEMSKNANLELYRDFNGNRSIDSGDRLVGISTFGGDHDEAIDLSFRQRNVNPGSYVIRVKDADPGGKFRYNMKVSAYADPNPNQLLAGETEVTLGGSSQSFNGSIDISDNTDTYRLTVPSRRTYNFLTSGNNSPGGADINLRLVKDTDGDHVVDSGEEIARSAEIGDTESFSRVLDPGEHYVQVYGNFINTSGSGEGYTLSVL